MTNFTTVREKILVLTSTFPTKPEDAEPRFVLDLCRGISSEFDVIVLAPHCSGSATFEEMEGVQVHRFRYAPGFLESVAYKGGVLVRLRQNRLRFLLLPFFFTAFVCSAIKLLKRENINIIHAHWIIPQGAVAVLARFLCGKSGVKIISTAHGADIYATGSPLWRWLKRLVLERTDSVTVVSSSMKLKITRDFPTINAACKVVPMGVELQSRFSPVSVESFLLRSGLVFVGRLVEKKGVEHLINAIKILSLKNELVELKIIGDGPLRKELELQVRSLGLQEQIHFLGAVDHKDLPYYYRRAQGAIFPFVVAQNGDQEGLGLVVVEAQGCGCPIIASKLPALSDSVKAEQRSWLVSPGKPDELAKKIEELIYMEKMALFEQTETARRYAFECFDWSKVSEKYIKIIKDIQN